ncbi:MAG: RNA polymerase sigma factor [Chitinophagales bacterium]|nr:RNA polymerase sigma factor [Chitinophagales bacterium]
MRLIRLQQDLSVILKKASEGEHKAQKIVYDRFSGRVLSICKQYVGDIFIAEDLMITAFLKIFRALPTLENMAVFESWMRKITIHECISYIRSKKQVHFIEPNENSAIDDARSDDGLILHDLQAVLDTLPYGCKMVFNLYAIDGYKHHEIAEMLDISTGTSKSQLAYARKLLQEKLNLLNQVNHG